MEKPSEKKVRWLLFDDEELRQLKDVLDGESERNGLSVDVDQMHDEIRDEMENRSRGGGVWYFG